MWLILPVVLAAMFMYGFDQNVVNVALPTLRTDLHAGPVALELVVGGYVFAYAAGLVTGGRLGDLYGHKRMFMIGVAAFAVVSVGAGLAASPAELVGARLLQGLAAALMVPQVLAMITTTFPPAQRVSALGWFGVTGALSGVIGQALGGFLVDLDWRIIFLVNLPIGAILLAFAARLLPASTAGRRARLDVVGMAGMSVGAGLALAALALGLPSHWVLLVISGPVLALTLRYEARRPDPLVDLSLLRLPGFGAGLGLAAAFLAYFSSSFFVLSLLLQDGLGLSAVGAGLAFTPFAAVAGAVAIAGRALVSRWGAAMAIRTGCAISAVGLIALVGSLTFPRFPIGGLVGELAVVGAGNALIMTAYLGATLSAVPAAAAGLASGMLNTLQQFAGATGLAGVGAVFFAALGDASSRSAYTHATAIALSIGLVLVIAIAGLTWLLPGRDPDPRRIAQTRPATVNGTEAR